MVSYIYIILTKQAGISVMNLSLCSRSSAVCDSTSGDKQKCIALRYLLANKQGIKYSKTHLHILCQHPFSNTSTSTMYMHVSRAQHGLMKIESGDIKNYPRKHNYHTKLTNKTKSLSRCINMHGTLLRYLTCSVKIFHGTKYMKYKQW